MLISGAGEDEVEAIVEANAEGAYALACGLAGPAVRAGEVVQERRHRADESTCLTRAMARRVRAHQAVAFLIMVGQPHGTAMGSMRAWDSDGLHQILHAMAPAVDA